MSLDDFCRLTPEEFSHVCDAHNEWREQDSREAWEQTRAVATLCVQPHLKRSMTAKQLMPFPWDKKQPSPPPKPEMTKEEEKAVFERLAKEY